MKKNNILAISFFLLTIVIFFRPFLFQEKLPIPADTIVGLYHPFRDLYAKDYPNGIPYKNFLITDPVRQQYPWRTLAITTERQGQLPLWNPYNFSGTPLLANFQTATFYPMNILFFVLPLSLSWSVLIMLQPLLAGIFLYMYLRNLRLQQFASVLGGLVFAFCGFSVAWMEWGVIGHVALWLPLLLLSIDKLFSKQKKANNTKVWSVIFLFSLSAAFFAGHLQMFFYLAIVTGGYFIARWWQFGKNLKILFHFSFLFGVFLVLTFVQWWPTLQFILQSARDVDQIPFQTEGWFIPWLHLIQFIVPDFFGNPTTLNYWGVWNYGELVGYVGILPLLLASLALFFRRDKKTLFFGLLLLLALLFSLPTFFAQIPYHLQIPFLSTAQPTRLLFLIDFALAVLAALGLDSFLNAKKKKHLIISILFIFMIFMGLWFLVLIGNQVLQLFSTENVLIARRNLLFPSIIFTFVIFLLNLILIFKDKKMQSCLVFILLVITAADLLRFAEKFTPFTPQNYLFPSTKSVTYLQNQPGPFRIMATDSQLLPPNFSLMYKLQSLDGYDPLYLRRYGELIASLERDKPDIHTPFGFNRIITPKNRDSRLVDLLGVKYILSLSELKSSKFEMVYTEGKTKIYENKHAFPRAFFVSTVKSVPDKTAAIEGLFDAKINLRNTAIVEGWDQNEKFSSGSAMIVTYDANKVVMTTEVKESSFLVFMDTYYPTWHAKVCSEDQTICNETKIYRTNYNFRGIIVPPEKKTIIFYNTLL